MLSKIPNPIKNYPQRFQEIYLISKEFSEENHFNFEDVFDEAVKFHDPQYPLEQIKQSLQSHRFQALSTANSNSSRKSHAVWLLFGETGQGKTTFTNVICGSQVAVEGEGIKSKTKEIGLHISKKERVIIIDTPGLFDTRRIKNKEILNQVVDIVQNELNHNAHIDAIFFFWSPTASMRLGFEEILISLKKSLVLDLLDEKGLTNPVLLVDVMRMDQEDMSELREATEKVESFREGDFEAHRIMSFFKKFLEVQRLDAEEKKQRGEIEKEVGSKFEKRATEMEVEFQKNVRQMEEKFKEDIKKQEAENEEKNKKLQEEHKSSMRVLEEKGNRLESEVRQEKERSRRETERRTSEERRIRKENLKREGKLRDELIQRGRENEKELKKVEQRYQDELKQQRKRNDELENKKQKPEETKSEESFWKKIPYEKLIDLAANHLLPKNDGSSTTNRTGPSENIYSHASTMPSNDAQTRSNRDKFPPSGPWGGGLNPGRGKERSSDSGGIDNPFSFGRPDRLNDRPSGMDKFLDRKGIREKRSFEAPGSL